MTQRTIQDRPANGAQTCPTGEYAAQSSSFWERRRRAYGETTEGDEQTPTMKAEMKVKPPHQLIPFSLRLSG